MDYIQFELYHHGIIGQKWGVRRYQNEDGSLTDAGKKRYQKEAAQDIKKISKGIQKAFDSYDAVRRSKKIRYFVDDKGANSYDSSGNPSFDTSKGILIYDQKKWSNAKHYSDKMDKLEKLLTEKYDTIEKKGGFYEDAGKAELEIILRKYGEEYRYNFSKNYGNYDIPIDFVTYKKDLR